uniref:CAAX prenyl protease n=1 Tax=Cacopsylla melanoneura TaxID=428564 RepID=A0A8D8XT19_9HEMI
MDFTLEFQIFYGFIAFSWVLFLFELYLSIRQRKVYHENTIVPHQIAHDMDVDSFEKSRQYSLDKNMFSIFKETVSQVMNTVLLCLNGLPYFWFTSEKLAATYFGFHQNEIVTSCIFIVLFTLFSTVVGIPISLYHHFVLEEKHGFNKQTIGFFMKDQIKGLVVSLILSVPLTGAVVYIIQLGGNMVFLYLWVFIILMSLFLMTIYPEFIAPLFDKYTPLPEGELKSRIEQLSASVKFPLKKLYVVEGSKRSEHSNAYFYGFFKNKRIVLFDTLLKDYVPVNGDKKKEDSSSSTEQLITPEPVVNKKGCDTEEVLAVLAHELGHWKYNHVLKSMIVMQLNLLFMLYSFQYLFQYKPLYSSFGFYNSQPILLGLLIVLQYVFAPYNQLVQFLMTCMTRYFEFQADAFGKSQGKAVFLRKALLKINKDNLGFPVCDWMFSLYHNSHPPLLERLQALDKDE